MSCNKHNSKWIKNNDGSQTLRCLKCGKITARFNYLQALKRRLIK